jgi:hypothetical protein
VRKKTFVFSFLFLVFISNASALAAYAPEITVSGKITDWDEERVFIETAGVELGLPKRFLDKKMKIDSGKKISVQMSFEDFQKKVKKRFKPKT